MSEKEWARLAQQQNLDPATGKKIEQPSWEAPEEPPAWEPRDVTYLFRLVGELRDGVKTLQLMIAVGFAIVVALILIK